MFSHIFKGGFLTPFGSHPPNFSVVNINIIIITIIIIIITYIYKLYHHKHTHTYIYTQGAEHVCDFGFRGVLPDVEHDEAEASQDTL